jgi:putative DNA primase/helicase
MTPTEKALHDEALSLYISSKAKTVFEAVDILFRNHLDIADCEILDSAAEAAWQTHKAPHPPAVPSLPAEDAGSCAPLARDNNPSPRASIATSNAEHYREKVPEELKREPRWLVYKLVWRPERGKFDKKPFNPLTGQVANNSKLGGSFEEALAHLDEYDGLGFYVEPPYLCIDIDGCRDSKTAQIELKARNLICDLDTYTEVSPSGTGVHIWAKGVKPGPVCRKGKIEIYDTGRFMTVTGDHVPDCFKAVCDRDITAAYMRMLAGDFEPKNSQLTEQPRSAAAGAGSSVPVLRTDSSPFLIDNLADKIELLMEGSIIPGSRPFVVSSESGSLSYTSQSEADLALCSLLAIKSLDAGQIDEQFRKSVLYRPKWERNDYRADTIQKAIKSAEASRNESILVLTAPPTIGETAATLSEVDEDSEAAIPPFDPSVMNGIYADFVELVTRATTLNPQFAYAIAKTVVGIRMAGKVKFEDLDVEPRYYTALIGKTGSGKGETWRRTYQILKIPGLIGGCGFKIVNDLDSGAGLKDLFFPSSKMESEEAGVFVPQPVLCFIDEVTTIGHKSAETRNPGIVDELITLANSTSISRNLAKRSGGSRSTDQARLALVMGGQDGSVYMKAFAGRTQLGMYDRLYPEYGVQVEVGDLPTIDAASAMTVMHKFNSLEYSGTMTMSPDAKALLDECWSSQSAGTRKKARWRSNLKLDAYMSAFGRALKIVEAEDAKVAIKIFERQLIIRRVCFTTEVPDRIGYYLGLIKRITERMIKQLAAGMPPEQVAKSRRDYERATNAYRDNEEHIFSRAWDTHVKVHLKEVTIRKSNGQEYQKFVPVPQE